jgi:hypothetical protein
MTVPANVSNQSWTGLWSKDSSGVGRKIVAISAFGRECKTLETLERKDVCYDLTISSSELLSFTWKITGYEEIVSSSSVKIQSAFA